MIQVFSGFTSYVAGYLGLNYGLPSRSSVVIPRPIRFVDIPIDVVNGHIMSFLSLRERHTFKATIKGVSCPCFPLCQLACGVFKKVLLSHSVAMTPRGFSSGQKKPVVNGNFTTFSYDPGLGRLIMGDNSNYTTNAAVTVFDTEGKLQLVAQNSSWDKHVVALKQVEGLIIVFGYREMGIWSANDGTKIREWDKNPFELKMCVFSENKKIAFVAGDGHSMGTIDYMAADPWSTYQNFSDSTHKDRISWIKEDLITGFVLSGSNEGIVNIRNQDHQFVRSIKTGETWGKYVYHASKQLLFASIDSSTVGVWDTTNGKLNQVLRANHELAVTAKGFTALEWNERENYLCASWKFLREGELGGALLIWWNIESGDSLGKFLLVDPHNGLYSNVWQIAFNITEGLILIGGYGLELWNKKGQLLWQKYNMGFIERFEWDARNKRIITQGVSVNRSNLTVELITYKE